MGQPGQAPLFTDSKGNTIKAQRHSFRRLRRLRRAAELSRMSTSSQMAAFAAQRRRRVIPPPERKVDRWPRDLFRIAWSARWTCCWNRRAALTTSWSRCSQIRPDLHGFVRSSGDGRCRPGVHLRGTDEIFSLALVWNRASLRCSGWTKASEAVSPGAGRAGRAGEARAGMRSVRRRRKVVCILTGLSRSSMPTMCFPTLGRPSPGSRVVGLTEILRPTRVQTALAWKRRP